MATDKELMNKYFSYSASELRKLKEKGTRQQRRVAKTLLYWEGRGRKKGRQKREDYEQRISKIFGM
jgi:hypothetical protein